MFHSDIPKSSMPTKALICYCPHEPNQTITNVDAMTEKGCSGKMALEETVKDTTVLQLLGLYKEKDDDIKSIFKQRFNDLSLGIISNCESTREIAFNLDSHYSEIESKQQIQQFLSSGIDVIFIDFTNYDNSWSFINELVALENVNYIQCIISPTKIEHERNPFQTIRPTQSYTMKDGVQVSCINKETELNYSYYHLYSGLKDNSTKYNQDRTGYFKTLAWHFMAEVGHKLGFVPKYGA